METSLILPAVNQVFRTPGSWSPDSSAVLSEIVNFEYFASLTQSGAGLVDEALRDRIAANVVKYCR